MCLLLGLLAGLHRRLGEILSWLLAFMLAEEEGVCKSSRHRALTPAGQDWESRDREQGEEGPEASGDPSSSSPDLETPPAPQAAGATHNATVLV